MAELDEETRAAAAGVTQLEFHQAMNDFKTMFPEMDEDVIECVLRSNNGAVDSTIDQLLQLSVETESERVRGTSPVSARPRPPNPNLLEVASSEFPPRYSATPPPTYNQAVPDVAASAAASIAATNTASNIITTNNRTLKNCNMIRNNIDPAASSQASGWSSAGETFVKSSSGPNNLTRVTRKWNPPMLGPLPDTFLRISSDNFYHRSPSNVHHEGQYMSSHSLQRLLQHKMQENERLRRLSSREDDPEAAQYLEDERVAIFLQNEEFMRELQNNQEFLSTLQMDAARNGQSLPDGPSSHGGQDSDKFSEMLKNMGETSRKKFAQLAGLFSRRKRSGFLGRGSTGEALAANPNRNSRDMLISGQDDEYKEFENDDTSGSERAESPRDGTKGTVRRRNNVPR